MSHESVHQQKGDYEKLKSFLHLFFAIIFCSSFHYAWLVQVHPEPVGDAQLKLINPIKDYLILRSGKDPGHSYATHHCNYFSLPSGFSLFALVLHHSGFSNLFLEFEQLLSFPIIFLLCFCLWWSSKSSMQFWRLLLLLFFFPPTQAAFRSLSPHGIILVLSLCAAFLFPAQNSRDRFPYLFSLFIFLFAISIKHLGLFLFLNFCVALILWKRAKELPFGLDLFCLGSVLLLGLGFYDITQFQSYINSLLFKDQNIGLLLLGAAILGILLLFTQFTIFKRMEGMREPNILAYYFLFVLLSFWSIESFFKKNEILSQGLAWECVGVLLFGYALIFFLIQNFSFDSRRGFLSFFALFFLTHSALLYFSGFGVNLWIFASALSFVLLASILQSKKAYLDLPFLIFLIGLSNFLPSPQAQHRMNPHLANLGSQEGFNVHMDNLFSWKPWGFSKIKRDFQRDLSAYEYELQTTSKFNSIRINGIWLNLLGVLRDRLSPEAQFQHDFPALRDLRDQCREDLRFRENEGQLQYGCNGSWKDLDFLIFVNKNIRYFEHSYLELENQESVQQQINTELARIDPWLNSFRFKNNYHLSVYPYQGQAGLHVYLHNKHRKPKIKPGSIKQTRLELYELDNPVNYHAKNH